MLNKILLACLVCAASLYVAESALGPQKTFIHKEDLLHPEWYPADFVKWSVPFDALPTAELHHSHFFPPYCSGGGYLLGPAAAAATRQSCRPCAAASTR